MKKRILRKLSLLTVFLLLFTLLFACAPTEPGSTDNASDSGVSQSGLDSDGSYTSAEDVSAYLLAYGRLPQNFITKKECALCTFFFCICVL